MFTYICTIIAVTLAAMSVKEYLPVAITIAAAFILEKFAYNYLFLEIRADNGWLIYLIYSTIQLMVMALLLILKSHFVIAGLIFMNLGYNLLTASSYFYSFNVNFYQAYQYFVGTIMVFELIYLGLLNRYVYSRKHRRNNTAYLDAVFCVRVRDIDGGVA